MGYPLRPTSFVWFQNCSDISFSIVGRGFLTPVLWRPSSILPTANPSFSKFCPPPPHTHTQPSPALLFLLMGLHMSSLCIIVSEGPCCVFYATRSLLRSDTKYDSLLVLWFDITLTNTHSTHSGQTQPYRYILTPTVMCSQQLSILKWMNNLLISKICFPKFSNLFAFQKLLTCSHISAD